MKFKNIVYSMLHRGERRTNQYTTYNIQHTRNGFTLIELLLYVAIAATLLVVSTLFLATLLDSRVKNQTIAEVDQQGLQVMQIISQTIYNAEGITSPAAGVSASSLTLDIVGTSNDPTILDLNSGVLRIKEGAGSTINLTNSRVEVSNLSFTNLSRAGTPGIVKVNFTINYINNSGRNEYEYSRDFQSSVSLRHP